MVKWPFFRFRTLPARLFPWNTPEIGKRILNATPGRKPARRHLRHRPKFQRDSFAVIKGHGSGAIRAKVPERRGQRKNPRHSLFLDGRKATPQGGLPRGSLLTPPCGQRALLVILSPESQKGSGVSTPKVHFESGGPGLERPAMGYFGFLFPPISFSSSRRLSGVSWLCC